ncbi:N-acetylmannosamine-6-phosphate 2-epimerase [Salmonella enterica subsp. enterica serovar Daytona]|uniref:N-acylglucosamine-6-phosphate 2-epimerase n=1 Tax=Salmonella enterica subsp. enterica serovar Daytona TaxID=1962639 RepID=A0A447JJU8_SALET|nr:N-acetylmannosamine-6-phosphate 2-epimerase [Salmonella enterica subsp. enterica serovar Daytona]
MTLQGRQSVSLPIYRMLTPWRRQVPILSLLMPHSALRPVDIDSLLTRIRLHGLLAMADCSTVNEGISCHQKGIEFIGTTLSGYTGPITPVEPDLAMVTQLSHAGCRVIAEGRYNTPATGGQCY